MTRIALIIALFGCVFAGCNDEPRETEPPERREMSSAPVAWGEIDRPTILSPDMNFVFAELPLEGEAEKIPWAGSYWPTYLDSLNDRWAGAEVLSPAEKFAQAFDRPGLTDNISRIYGIDSHPDNKPCTEAGECNAVKGEACAKRQGQETGRCIETWFGICHAWGPAAVKEYEPLRAVTHNGVEFRINDIKALVTLSYDEGLEQRIMSLRCDRRNTGGEDGIGYDEFGRPDADANSCADTNAGSFHVAITNLLGIQRVGFVEDRTYDYEVWNQPVRKYRVNRSEAVDAARAAELVGAPPMAPYPFNPEAVSFQYIETALGYIFETHQSEDGNVADHIDDYTGTDEYAYVLELDADGRIIGGEWVGESKQNHPDFLWMPGVKANTEVARTMVTLAEVSNSVRRNRWKKVGGYDVEAGEKLHVTMTGDGDADLYVRFGGRPYTSRYDCRPILPGSAETCTLEVPEGQRRVHVYTKGFEARSAYNIKVAVERNGTGIRWSDVQALLAPSVAEVPVVPPPEPTRIMEQGAIMTKQWLHFGPYAVASGPLAVTMNTLGEGGDVDLYVRAGAQPTADDFDCRPWEADQTEETCSVSGGEIYVSIYGYAGSDYSLAVSYLAAEMEMMAPPVPPPGPMEVAIADAAAKSEWKHYGPYQVFEGTLRAVVTGQAGDLDLYVRTGAAPTDDAFDCRPWLEGTAAETCEVNGPGQVFVSVFGYEPGGYALQVNYTGR